MIIVAVIVMAAVVVGLVASMGMNIINLPWVVLSLLRGGQTEQATVTWSSPTPTIPPTLTPSPTRIPAAFPTYTPTVLPATATPTPTVYIIYYTVQPNETLADIAAKFGVTEEALRLANQLAPEATIFPGQVLFILMPMLTPTPAPTWTPVIMPTLTVGP
ncbi:MAG: LysM peptidoglycan-binding domain-containing protein [Chloroflexi bacterium]|nr:LysM peptidoglycan-binding domain-containing protein [Chloroflexota bacterium]MBU1747507.1 LysM peptidoglycan-binding domain-containing protein [Chloroflexota bacterium]